MSEYWLGFLHAILAVIAALFLLLVGAALWIIYNVAKLKTAYMKLKTFETNKT